MKKILVIVALMMAFSAFANADTLAIGETKSFSWFTPDGNPVYATPTYTINGYARIDLLDCCVVGDRFALYDGATLLGTTSVPGPGLSSGTFYLGGGLHTLSIQVIEFAPGFASGGASISASVPEPGTLALLGAGLLGFGFRRFRKI
jgi:hypothetical protein